jgi:hypothetical protein
MQYLKKVYDDLTEENRRQNFIKLIGSFKYGSSLKDFLFSFSLWFYLLIGLASWFLTLLQVKLIQPHKDTAAKWNFTAIHEFSHLDF